LDQRRLARARRAASAWCRASFAHALPLTRQDQDGPQRQPRTDAGVHAEVGRTHRRETSELSNPLDRDRTTARASRVQGVVRAVGEIRGVAWSQTGAREGPFDDGRQLGLHEDVQRLRSWRPRLLLLPSEARPQPLRVPYGDAERRIEPEPVEGEVPAGQPLGYHEVGAQIEARREQLGAHHLQYGLRVLGARGTHARPGRWT